MEEQRQLKIKAKDEDLKGSYSNLMQVVHTKDEFILDFFMVSPPQGVLCSRIIMSPGHFRRMLKAVSDNISKYEERFGKIKESEEPKTDSEHGGIGFKPETSK